MAVFNYTALDATGKQQTGTIDAGNVDMAITSIQRRGLIISAINEANTGNVFNSRIRMFERVSTADIVMLSRQMTTLFEAHVSALRAFKLLASEARTPLLAEKLNTISSDIQSGSPIHVALQKHKDVFSSFYINMVKAGEESGKLDETFAFLADYLDRNYAITQKAKNALIYPAFVILTFVIVMTLMMTVVIPKLSDMLSSAGQNIPIYTKVVIGISQFMSHYIYLILFGFVVGVGVLYRYGQTEIGRDFYSRNKLKIPIIGQIYSKIYLSRIADNLSTMLKSGIQILRGLEITADVVEDPVYSRAVRDAAVDVKAGLPLSDALRKQGEFPGIVIAMVKIGEETGNMGTILETMARFYHREVDNAVDTMVSLIEPLMIVSLAVGVAVLLASVLMPIYNLASSF